MHLATLKSFRVWPLWLGNKPQLSVSTTRSYPSFTILPPCWLLLLLFSRSFVSDSLRPHGLQHTRLPCSSATPGACSNSCPSSRWCHPTLSSSVVPFSCPQSFPASGSFLMSQLFVSGGQSIGASASASVLPVNIQDWFPLGWTGLISLQSTGPLRSLLQHHSSKASILRLSVFFMVQLSHPYMTTGDTIALTIWTFAITLMKRLTCRAKLPSARWMLMPPSPYHGDSDLIFNPPSNAQTYALSHYPKTELKLNYGF